MLSRPAKVVSQCYLAELQSCLNLLFLPYGLTSVNGFRGGPDAMSADFVPGRILLSAPCSSFEVSSEPAVDVPWIALMPGEFGVIWTSVKGGGLGRRGELEGDAGLMLM